MPTLEVQVTHFTDVGGHTEYVIEATYEGRKVRSQHRFSAFLDLHSSIQPYLASKLPVVFPIAKSVFGGDVRQPRRSCFAGLFACVPMLTHHPPRAVR